MKPASYEIVERESCPECLVIRDNGPWNLYSTITNAAEAVVKELYANSKLVEGQMLLYYDSDNNLDELVHKDGKFVGFRKGPK